MTNIFWKNLHLCLPPLKHHHSSSPHIKTSDTALFDNTNCTTSTSNSNSSSMITDDFYVSSDVEDSSSPDFATVFRSQRLFFSSPGPTNSIIRSPDRLPEVGQVAGGVAVSTYSPDPAEDFRRSMQEMIEASRKDNGEDHDGLLEYLHELLLCYLKLNAKENHKYVISAFTDVVVSLLSPEDNMSSQKPCPKETSL